MARKKCAMDIESIRKYCLGLPAVTEDIKWQHNLCFLIAGKIFLMADLEPSFGVSFKVTDEEFEELISTEGIISAPYLGGKKWIKVLDENRFAEKEWKHYIFQSWEIKKAKLPKKVLKHYNL
jgi:predicted DNA-binding protein (MmcQ/YjbR family)